MVAYTVNKPAIETAAKNPKAQTVSLIGDGAYIAAGLGPAVVGSLAEATATAESAAYGANVTGSVEKDLQASKIVRDVMAKRRPKPANYDSLVRYLRNRGFNI